MFNRLYIYGIISICVLGGVIYHLTTVGKLKEEIRSLEKNLLIGQHRYINCEQNVTKLNEIINKQNERLKSINEDFKKNMARYAVWKNLEDNKKYNSKVLSILNSSSSADIAKQLNQMNFLNELD